MNVRLDKLKVLTILLIMGCALCNSERTSRSSRSRHTASRRRHHRSSGTGGSSSDTSSQTHGTWEEYNNNFQLVSQWRCGTPKPRVVYLNEAIGGGPTIQPSELWHVTAAILHRCENALGCCEPGKTCTETSEEEVTITFKKQDMVTHVNTYPQYRFKNHTACACR